MLADAPIHFPASVGVVANDEFGRGYKFREALHVMGERYLLEIRSEPFGTSPFASEATQAFW